MVQLIDDDIAAPIITNLQIIETSEKIHILFDAYDKTMGDDRGIGMVNLYIDGELIHSVNSIPVNQSHFEFQFENKWGILPGDHAVLVEVWDNDNDREFDSLKADAHGSFSTKIDTIKSNTLSIIDNLTTQLEEYTEENWVENHREIMTNRLFLTQNLILEHQYDKAYNYLLRAVKPKLTSNAQNELGETVNLLIPNEDHIADQALKNSCIDTIDKTLGYLRVLLTEFGSSDSNNIFFRNIWPIIHEISVVAYYNYLDRDKYSRPMVINGEESDIMVIHYRLAQITLFLQIRFFTYLLKLNKPIFSINNIIWRILEPTDNLKVIAIKESANRAEFERLTSFFLYYKIPNFGPWDEFEEIDGIQDQIIIDARKIRNLNLRFDLLDWYLAENLLLLEKLSEPYRHGLHFHELDLIRKLDDVSKQTLKINGCDSLALLNEIPLEILGEILDTNQLDLPQIKEELSKIRWL